MDAALKCSIQSALLDMHHDPRAAAQLRKGLIMRFVPIADEHYHDIRQMSGRVMAIAYAFK